MLHEGVAPAVGLAAALRAESHTITKSLPDIYAAKSPSHWRLPLSSLPQVLRVVPYQHGGRPFCALLRLVTKRGANLVSRVQWPREALDLDGRGAVCGRLGAACHLRKVGTT